MIPSNNSRFSRQTLAPEHFSIDEEAHKKGRPVTAPNVTSRDGEKDEELGTNPGPLSLINAYGDEDSLLVEIPSPGLHLRLGANEKPPTRLVSGMCTICLCTFDVGSDVVWSSNELCEHVFHANCVEKWLMRQREGPLCPCCRRDFIVDPYDLETNEGVENIQPTILNTPIASSDSISNPVLQRGVEVPNPNNDEMQS